MTDTSGHPADTSGHEADRFNGYLLRTATDDDLEPLCRLAATAFCEDFEQESMDAERLVFEPGRCHLAVADGQIAGNVGAYSRDLTVPGAVLPAAHVSFVCVDPAHRRRGLLSQLIGRQFAEMRAAGEPVAVLWASEGRIYQRFGYGLATRNVRMEINSREVSLSAAALSTSGTIRGVAPADAKADLRRVYDQVRVDRPGWGSRHERWWDWMLADPKPDRRGATSQRVTLHEGPDGVDGYTLWRTKLDWNWGGPAGEVRLGELVATNAAAYAALWRHLITMDLTRSVVAGRCAADEPLVYMVDEPRQLRCTVGDGLWLRLVDVPAALAGRRYAAPIDVVIEVTDAVLPDNAGRYRLRADADAPAACERTGEPADIACDVRDLGAAYLGGVALTRLADTGRVRELRPGALAAASTAFGWHRSPSAGDMF